MDSIKRLPLATVVCKQETYVVVAAVWKCNRKSRQRLDRHGTIAVGSCETFHHYNVQGVK